jgi:integrase
MKLTIRRIRELDCTKGRDRLVFDDEQRGLAVRVTSTGTKSYLVQYSIGGRKRRIPLGSCDAVSLADARLVAQGIMGMVAHGRDPALERKAQAQALASSPTLGALVEQWQAIHLKDKRQSYAREAVRAIRYTFASLLKRPVAAIDRAAILQIIDRNKPIAATRAVSYAASCCQWAKKRGKIATNPFADLPKAPDGNRERVLSDEEIAKIWAATATPGAYNGIVRLLLVTGQRRNEVAGLMWGDELDADLTTWTLPATRAKNNATHVVPLSPLAKRTIIEYSALPAAHTSDRLFPGTDTGGPFGNFARPKAVLDKASGVTDWTLHDLRRTVATNLQRLGVRLEATEAVLNHISGTRGGIAGVYQRHDWADEKRAALGAWGERLTAIVEGRSAAADKVAKLYVTGR